MNAFLICLFWFMVGVILGEWTRQARETVKKQGIDHKGSFHV